MKKLEISIEYKEYNDFTELDSADAELLARAKLSAQGAYAPYSHFQVGSALRLKDGTIITGNNQENAAYPSGLCAERVALFAASANHPGIHVSAIAISARSDDFMIDYPVTPCGSCRQVMAEYQTHFQHPIRIIMSGEKGKIFIVENVADVLPLMFDSSQLKRKSNI